MKILQLSENLVHLRKKRKITQEEVAEFIGVTKASVSKWENGQSLPDILLLPQLATFFDVTVDALLGYEPQMSKEQIRSCYQKLAADFANRPFDEVMQESENLVKKYYSCYPFLMQICVLWINHFFLVEEKERQNEILEKIKALCQHILNQCNDLVLGNQAMEMMALVNLQQGQAAEVIEQLEEICEANCYERKSSLLIQAYLMQQKTEQADKTVQVDLYRNVVQLVSNQILLLTVHHENRERCEEIIKRTDQVIEAFELQYLNPNLIANYQLQAALMMVEFGEENEACLRLEYYADAIEALFQMQITLHGDQYFDRLEEWLENLQLGGERVRDQKLVADSARSIFSHPVLQKIKDKKRLEEIKRKVMAVSQIE